eukprot:135662-Amphidinium_carterae.1
METYCGPILVVLGFGARGSPGHQSCSTFVREAQCWLRVLGLFAVAAYGAEVKPLLVHEVSSCASLFARAHIITQPGAACSVHLGRIDRTQQRLRNPSDPQKTITV